MVKLFETHSIEDNKNNMDKLIKIEYYNGDLRNGYINIIKIFSFFLIPLIILGYIHYFKR